MTGTVRSRRLRLEAVQLAYAYPNVTVAEDDSWVVIGQFRLPRGWEPAVTPVLIAIPPNYPEVAPDGFHLGAELRRRQGRKLVRPDHYFRSYKNRFADLGYWWYCLEDPDGRWDYRRDSLRTFVEAIRTYLGSPD